jgi:disulfide bond formation protein DsbB
LGLAVIGYVLFAQYVEGFHPCELCLRERWPWYAVIGLGLVGVALPSRLIVAAIAVTFLVAAGLGLHHVGVEQHWWAGPSACTGGLSGAATIEELRAFMHKQQLVQCDVKTWTVLGLSMATYNFIVALIAGALALAVTVRPGAMRADAVRTRDTKPGAARPHHAG